MDIVLNPMEARVLGSLVEKDATTPDYYPLSLNALVNACNQKSSRDPVMSLSEDDVRGALRTLNDKGLAGAVSSADSRVPKYEHRMQEVFNLTRAESAVICVLLLRGAQTPGELRGRTERLYAFEDVSDVQSTLQRLLQRQPPLVKMLPRQPGTKESRYVHLLAGDVDVEYEPAPETRSKSGDDERIAVLEETVRDLDKKLADLQQQLADFRKQFE
jgi:uncharacterized protein YceH (UPF0502 family)